jgi:hypothetical protein
MTIPIDSQNLESYVPVYDAIPEKWDDAKPFIVEQLKKISNAVNIREIGWFLDQELLSGKAFIPGSTSMADLNTSQVFRQVLRKVIIFPGLTIGANTQLHGITVDANFTLVQLYAGATNSTSLIGEPIPNGADTISYTSTSIIITTAAAYDRCYATIEYLQEV